MRHTVSNKRPNGKLDDVAIYFKQETGQYIVGTHYKSKKLHVIISGRADKNIFVRMPDEMGKYSTPEYKDYERKRLIIYAMDEVGDKIAWCLKHIARSLGRGVKKRIINPEDFVFGSWNYKYFVDVLHLATVAFALYRACAANGSFKYPDSIDPGVLYGEISLPFVGNKDDHFLYVGTIVEPMFAPGATTEKWIISNGFRKIDTTPLWDIDHEFRELDTTLLWGYRP